MRRRLWALLTIVAGVICLLLALVGSLLPFLPGFVFLILGVALLSREVPWIRRRRDRFKARHPRLFRRQRGRTPPPASEERLVPGEFRGPSGGGREPNLPPQNDA